MILLSVKKGSVIMVSTPRMKIKYEIENAKTICFGGFAIEKTPDLTFEKVKKTLESLFSEKISGEFEFEVTEIPDLESDDTLFDLSKIEEVVSKQLGTAFFPPPPKKH